MSENGLSFNLVPRIVDEILLRCGYFGWYIRILVNPIMSCNKNYAFSRSPNSFIYITIFPIKGVLPNNLACVRKCPKGER